MCKSCLHPGCSAEGQAISYTLGTTEKIQKCDNGIIITQKNTFSEMYDVIVKAKDWGCCCGKVGKAAASDTCISLGHRLKPRLLHFQCCSLLCAWEATGNGQSAWPQHPPGRFRDTPGFHPGQTITAISRINQETENLFPSLFLPFSV